MIPRQRIRPAAPSPESNSPLQVKPDTRPHLVLVNDDQPPKNLAEVGLRQFGFALCLYRNIASRPLL